METKVYKPIIKKFLKQDVRVVKTDSGKEYIVCKDMFNVLGLVNKVGSWNDAKKKMLEFLELVHKTPDYEELVVRLKDKQSKKGQVRKIDCLNIETVPLVLTQFQPINSNRRTKEQNEEILDRWAKFMEFVGVLLETYSANKYIFETKKTQVQAQDEIYGDGGEPMKMNLHVNQIMGYVLQMEDGKVVKKSEIYQLQNRITEDVGKVRDDILTTYVNTFKVIGDQSETYSLTLKWALKKYVK